jgi:hypothetical protein
VQSEVQFDDALFRELKLRITYAYVEHDAAVFYPEQNGER